MTTVRVRVPATSANLGPGFDALGLALAWYDDVEVGVAGSGLDLQVTGEGAGALPVDEGNLVVRAMRATFDRLDRPPPGLVVRCHNRIPQGRGLGSSAAAIVAGAIAATVLTGTDVDEAATLRQCADIEGHPDNVAACLLGGLTVAWTATDGVRATRLRLAAALPVVVLVPVATAATDVVRGLLPPSVPHREAAANAGRVAVLLAALDDRPDLLLDATEDRLHQPYRAAAMPETAALVARLRAAGIAAVVSGAGPSVLVLGSAGPRVVGYGPAGWRAHEARIDVSGTRWEWMPTR